MRHAPCTSILTSVWLMFVLSVAIGYDLASEGRSSWILYSSLGVSTVVALVGGSSSREWRMWWEAWRPFIYLVSWGSASVALRVFQEFAIAFTLTPFILVWLHVHRDKLKYESTTPDFIWSRSSLYAGIRAVSAWTVREQHIPYQWFPRLLPLALATLESVGMYVLDTKTSYTFAMHSSDFLTYVTLKSVVFAAVPWLEDALMAF